MEFIDLKTQYKTYKKEIDQAMQKVLDSSSYIMGPEVKELENALAHYVGVKNCLAVSSGTDTLLTAMMALNIGPGDEVITSPFTFIAPVEMIALLGAKSVYVDIDPETFNINVDELEKKITPQTKAIMPVSLFGQVPNYHVINAVAKKYNIPVIEDAAQSFGATQEGVKSCALSLVASTSFFPAKPYGCYGDGGALFTNNDELAAKMRAIRTHGGEVRNHHVCLGINGRLDTLQAAVLLAKLPHFDAEIKAREKIGAYYTELLKDCCITPVVAKGNTTTWAMYTIRHPERDRIAAHLKEKGIPTGIYYPTPCFMHAPYQDPTLDLNDYPHTFQACQEVLSLPMHPWLTQQEQEYVAHEIKTALGATA